MCPCHGLIVLRYNDRFCCCRQKFVSVPHYGSWCWISWVSFRFPLKFLVTLHTIAHRLTMIIIWTQKTHMTLSHLVYLNCVVRSNMIRTSLLNYFKNKSTDLDYNTYIIGTVAIQTSYHLQLQFTFALWCPLLRNNMWFFIALHEELGWTRESGVVIIHGWVSIWVLLCVYRSTQYTHIHIHIHTHARTPQECGQILSICVEISRKLFAKSCC